MSLSMWAAVNQLPLVASGLITIPLVAVVSPATFGVPAFQLGLVLQTAATGAAVAVPWKRLLAPA